jgi:acyl carrier protein
LQRIITGMNESAIKGLIAEHLAVPVGQVNETALFRLDLGADSLDMVQLAMLLESELGILIDDEEVEHCLSVGDALGVLRGKYVAERVNELPA